MRDHRPTLTQDLIASSRLGQLQEHAKLIGDINQQLQAILPIGLRAHCRAANISDNHLVVEVASASIQMKLNYDRIQILNQLRSQGYAGLMGIQIKINPSLYAEHRIAEPEAPRKPPVSEQAAEFILMAASGAPPKIKQRLENIARLAEKNKQEDG